MNVAGEGRYSRQEAIPLLSSAGQKLLSQASVTVVGAGGVKSPLLYYLAAAGVGRIRIIDFDRVELSNLNRQILYSMHDIGKFKAVAAAARLRDLNPEIEIEPVVERIDGSNFQSLTHDAHLLIEGGDSAEGRLLFNRLALKYGKTYIHASAQYNYGYVFTVVPGISACFECCFDDLPPSHKGAVPIIGCAAGIAGCVAATEAISILSGRKATLAGRLWLHDGWANETVHFELVKRSECGACGRSRQQYDDVATPT